MIPGCDGHVEDAYSGSQGSYIEKPDELYPEIRYLTDRVPVDILDWMDHRKHLVDAWKSSHEEFHQEFERGEACINQWI